MLPPGPSDPVASQAIAQGIGSHSLDQPDSRPGGFVGQTGRAVGAWITLPLCPHSP